MSAISYLIGREQAECAKLRDEVEILRTALADARAERDQSDAYIKSIWRNNQLPSPMDETLRERLSHKP